ncbi:MAG: redox-sensing transcriptional repressor Rex [Bacillota bacterium]|uniref:Redox-sensing transcriptional repressor Rex n=2 Tax=Carboxydocella TaxID=178898 RepID=A0A1T4S240_9FIRM|nr:MULTISPECIES: redox-sensing transcriptional repressor Rex [Carboxydocella]AVX21143.1 redox-sensing transcriptional repressor [Carboxydocella thermautotrophica]AVX31578.1 redox-sensing transcriptional repressor [Carboxydocella thermautotrophica]SKA21998.1 redox-sensing transcriptional repressor [Carboxydocella sporoproducens DSM 16521]GAW27793.1 redox-sensing transcriptional repressor Rex [Carboxydocella sp. ULO1]GAW30293.1 redox-sensing transcriptional repressor Rex [Carboxydocella sp. JDF6
MKVFKIPEATIIRLSVYSRFLEQADKKGIVTISSGEIAEGVGVSPAQVRKDLAYFGEFGTRGVGYNVKDLLHHTLKILGLSREWPVVVVGAGNLGTALVSYRGFRERGFKIVGIFDNDPNKIGKTIGDMVVQSMEELPETIAKKNAAIGVIAVPATIAQDVADLLVKAGIKAIMNFAPKALMVPDAVEIRNIDLAVTLEILTFNLCMRENGLL